LNRNEFCFSKVWVEILRNEFDSQEAKVLRDQSFNQTFQNGELCWRSPEVTIRDQIEIVLTIELLDLDISRDPKEADCVVIQNIVGTLNKTEWVFWS